MARDCGVRLSEHKTLECECGSKEFQERSPVKGFAIQTIDGDGNSLDHNENAFEFTVPKTVKCLACLARLPNPRLGRSDFR